MHRTEYRNSKSADVCYQQQNCWSEVEFTLTVNANSVQDTNEDIKQVKPL